jgi:hypothetical protein
MNRIHRTATMASIVTVLASLSLAGCGGSDGGNQVAKNQQTGAIEPFTSVASAADATPATPAVRTTESVPADSLPPDVVAAAEDSVATPGATVEFAAHASADAVEVFLWDGIGRKQSFAYDSTENVWRGRYRVPLGAPSGRLGLAVTAKNGHDLRSRVWVFLRIEREPKAAVPEKQPEAETAPTTGQ